ncbi:MAG: hypothetical protein RL033_5853 [Pseudomonadota bacterium]|jgi:serine/threonine-protein kinase
MAACETCGHQNQDGARFCAGCGGPLPTGEQDPTYPLIGQVVGGRYHIVSLIGEGGMGVVYKAEQRLGSTVRKVAVKTLHADLSRDPAITARFHREVGTIAQLEHPNTVKVYDFGSTDDGTLYIAMEFLDGKPLNRVIQADGALEPKRVSNLLRQMAGSLDEAHRQGIVHRDLKPENVILIERAGEKDVVKLVDFGIAARTESADRAKEQKLTQQGMVLGTPPYMSPEQFTGKALDGRSDVYSLGIMTYEMLTGQLPFQADTPWQWATHHMTSQPRSFDDLPAGRSLPEPVRRTVLKALAKDPGDRQSGAGQFHTEFLSALTATGTVPPPRAAAPVAAGGRTEAMPQVPLGMAATQAMPEAAPLSPGRAAPHTPHGPVALPPGPSRDSASGGKGLIYALGGAAALLGIGVIGALTMNRGGSSDSPPLDLQPTAEQATGTKAPSASTGSAAEPATIEPDPIPPSKEPSAPAKEPTAPSKTATTRPAGSKTPAPPATTPRPSTTPNPTAGVPQLPPGALPPGTQLPPGTLPPGVQLPAGTPTPAATPPASTATPAGGGTAACAACIQSAGSGAIVLAAAAHSQCTDASAKANCTSRASRTAGKEVVRLSRIGNCAEGKNVMRAALQMGVSEDKLANGRAACP